MNLRELSEKQARDLHDLGYRTTWKKHLQAARVPDNLDVVEFYKRSDAQPGVSDRTIEGQREHYRKYDAEGIDVINDLELEVWVALARHPKDPEPSPATREETESLNVSSILSEAHDLVTGDRQKDYGDPVECWDRTAKMFSAYLGIEVSARQASDMMILVKMSRLANGFHKDSYRDVAGYAWVSDQVGDKPFEHGG